MSIEFRTGNLLDADTEAIVNTVNCVGVMGKGVALAVKIKYPEIYSIYRFAFEHDMLQIGQVSYGIAYDGKIVINFPTKLHWRDPSRMSYIEVGIFSLARTIEALKIKSIAIPPLGCGNGRLDWQEVKPMIVEFAEKFGDSLRCVIYEPK